MSTDGTHKRVLTVFVASPGDVPEEREKAREVLLALNRQPHYRKTFVIEPYLWDDPHTPTPMSYTRTPEDSVVHYGERPGHCDLLIGILKHRLGSPLPIDRYGSNPDGQPFTGTEWEIHDAAASPGGRTDEVFVFVSSAPFSLPRGLSPADRSARQAQYDAVERFLDRLRASDGTYRGGVNAYDDLDGFETRLRTAVEGWLTKLEERAVEPSRSEAFARGTRPAAPSGRGKGPHAATEPPLLGFALDTTPDAEVRARLATGCTAPAAAVLTPRAELDDHIARGEFDALLGCLLGDDPLSTLCDLAKSCLDRDPPDKLADLRLRLRLVTEEPALAALPWQCLSHRGQSLGAAGWVVEAIVGKDADHLVPRTLPIDNPLILAPSDPTLEIGAAAHVSEVLDALRTLLGGRGQDLPWARTRSELALHLKQDPPDLVYLYTRLDASGNLILGRSEADRHGLSLAAFAELLEPCASKPVLWLNLIVTGRGAPTGAALVATLLDQCHALLIQRGSLVKPETITDRALGWLDALRAGQDDLAALMAGAPDPSTLLIHKDAPIGLRLPVAEDESGALRGRIRAALLRILLGREPEKNMLYGYATGARDGDLLAYVAVGDAQACVHDFPAQVRHRLEQNLDDGIRVVTRFVPAALLAIPDPELAITRLLKQHLMPTGGAPSEALERLLHLPPLDDETVVVALPWLLDLAPDLTETALEGWIEAWAGLHADYLADAVPPRCRVLLGACLQLDPGSQLTPERVVEIANGTLERVASRTSVRIEHVPLKQPLGKLTADHLQRFYAQHPVGSALLPNTLRRHAAALAEWIIESTPSRGGFADTVDRVYQEYKGGYTRFQRDPRTP